MFFIKRKKIVVDCFVNNPVIYDLFKIDHAHKYAPKEWRQLPPVVDVKSLQDPRSKETIPVPTAKRCVGIVNLFTTGFVMPCWSDFKIEMMNDGLFYKHDPMNELDANPHPPFMYWDSLYKGFQHVKISSPWLIKEKSGVNFTWNQCTYSNTDRHQTYHALSAVVDFKAQYNTHLNVFIKKGSTVTFNAGDPLVQMIPLSEKELEVKCHLIDDVEYAKMSTAYTRKSMWAGQHRALHNQKEESKCPFGFK
jgi:hypothetical protein